MRVVSSQTKPGTRVVFTQLRNGTEKQNLVSIKSGSGIMNVDFGVFEDFDFLLSV